MPKDGEKNVLPSGSTTVPPCTRPSKQRFASASSATVSDSPNPSKRGWPPAWPSDMSTLEPPMETSACITLSGATTGVGVPSGQSFCVRSGLSLKRVSIFTSAPTAFL